MYYYKLTRATITFTIIITAATTAYVTPLLLCVYLAYNRFFVFIRNVTDHTYAP